MKMFRLFVMRWAMLVRCSSCLSTSDTLYFFYHTLCPIPSSLYNNRGPHWSLLCILFLVLCCIMLFRRHRIFCYLGLPLPSQVDTNKMEQNEWIEHPERTWGNRTGKWFCSHKQGHFESSEFSPRFSGWIIIIWPFCDGGMRRLAFGSSLLKA